MSDTLPPIEATAPTPDFLARLREARFVSPGGTESRFLFDSLTRAVGKKGADHEIADSDDSVLQDLGNRTQRYPMDVYFVGDNYDVFSDRFFASLEERYTPDAPGILYHPRWGDIPVMPFGFEQSETFTGGGVGIGRVSVEFRQTKSLTYPATDGLSQSLVDAETDQLRDMVDTSAGEIAVPDATAYARFRSGMQSVITTVTDAIDAVSDVIEDAQSEADAFTQDVYSALDALSSPAIIMGQISGLVFGLADSVLSVPGRVTAYVDMTLGAIESLATRGRLLIGLDDKRQNAETLQAVGCLLTAATATAILNQRYETRDDVGAAVDSLVAVTTALGDAIGAGAADVPGLVSGAYIPDHNLLSTLADIATTTMQLSINRAFDLKAKKTLRLTEPSDALTITAREYGDLSRLDFFLRTNRITGNEFIEIPAGREVVVYV